MPASAARTSWRLTSVISIMPRSRSICGSYLKPSGWYSRGNASTAPKSGGPMRAVIVGAVESTRVTLQALADAPGWEAAALITLPPDLAARHSDFGDMSADPAADGSRLIHAPAHKPPVDLTPWSALSPPY